MKNLFDGGRLDVRQAGVSEVADAQPRPARRTQEHVVPAVLVQREGEVRKPEPPVTMEIVSGNKRTEVKFDKNGEGK